MNTVDLEARLIGLVHREGCARERIEVDTASRPGKPGPPARVAEVYRGTGRPTGRTFARGPARFGPATEVRVARCLTCGAEAVREIGQPERHDAIDDATGQAQLADG